MSEILNVIDVNDYGLQSMVAGSGGSQPNLQSKDVTISQNGTTTIEPDTGYDGLSDVDVTVSGILDTSDATAIAKNITNGATAYVNGVKITGTLPVLTYPTNPLNPQDWDYQFQEATSATLKRVTRDGTNYILGTHTVVDNVTEEWSFQGNSKMKMGFPENKIASTVGLTANKLKKDVTILGVTGTYEGEGGGIDWSEIGYSTPPAEAVKVENGYNYAKEIYDDWDNSLTNITNKFLRDYDLIYMPLVDMSNVTQSQNLFYDCSNLEYIPILDTQNNASLSNAFVSCPNLSSEALNNILRMCINSKYTAKSLRAIGLSQAQATTCQTLSNWSAFVAAGWRTGY